MSGGYSSSSQANTTTNTTTNTYEPTAAAGGENILNTGSGQVTSNFNYVNQGAGSQLFSAGKGSTLNVTEGLTTSEIQALGSAGSVLLSDLGGKAVPSSSSGGGGNSAVFSSAGAPPSFFSGSNMLWIIAAGGLVVILIWFFFNGKGGGK